MARGRYQRTKEMRFLESLVTFAEDRTAPLLTLAKAGRAYLLPATDDAFRGLTPPQVESLRQDLRAFLYAMAWDKDRNAAQEYRVSLTLVMAGGPHGIVVFADGAPRDVLLYQTQTLLQVIGTEHLRRCRAPDCGRAFVKRGRREYCSPRCQRRVFLSGYDPFAAQPQRKERARGKKTRTR
jgi:hypothetical protein